MREDSVLSFIKDIEADCKANNFKLELLNVRYIDIGDNAPSSGYFDDEERKIVVALKINDFIGTLAHEYSHMRQFVEDPELYNFYALSYSKVFQWLDGKRVRNLDFHLDNCMKLELDCEKRAVELFKLYDLNVDIKDYIQRANAYMYFWKYLKFSRKWCNPYNTPSNNETIVRTMPKRFLKEYEFTKEIKDLFKRENI